jgi:hypothetical protein
MSKHSMLRRALGGLALSLLAAGTASAQEARPWKNPDLEPTPRIGAGPQGDAYSQQPPAGYSGVQGYGSPTYGQGYPPRPGANDVYRPPSRDAYSSGQSGYGTPYGTPRTDDENGLYDRNAGRGYESTPAPERYQQGYGQGYEGPPRRTEPGTERGYYSQNEILDAGHGFFGSVSRGLASAVEWAFQNAGRPNGYILGEDAGGAFVAGLRYGEGVLHTKDAGRHKVYWQGPSLGYDVGAEGSKTMVLVYNLRDVSELYNRFGGVQGAAYLVGGVSVQLQKHGDVVLAPIRSGVGLRLGANVGYLKYTRSPTWNPF